MDSPYFWAKTTADGRPGISVRQHCLSVRYVAEELFRRYRHISHDSGLLESHVAFLGAAHDVGKISRRFQEKIPSIRIQKKNTQFICDQREHNDVSQDSVQQFLEKHDHDREPAYLWAAVVGAHHGELIRPPDAVPCRLTSSQEVLEDERQAFLEKMWQECGSPQFPRVNADSSNLWLMGGLLILADWLASGYFPAEHDLPEQELPGIAADIVSKFAFGACPIKNTSVCGEYIPNQMQLDCMNAITEPGVYILEAPMGMGKTEAALWASYNLLQNGTASGIYFALPTQTTSNRMFKRFKKFVNHICEQPCSTQLIHSHSWLDKESVLFDEIDKETWYNSPRRALLASFGVGTVDQALMSVLPVRFFALRRFALYRKVVIIDEVHTYDMYTGTLIEALCKELEKLQCTVIILSATLTSSAHRRLLGKSLEEESEQTPYPRLTSKKGLSIASPAPQEKTVHIRHISNDTAVQKAIELARNGAKVLWVCDTVSSAQETYRKLAPYVETGLLHARFPHFRRKQIEDTWLARFEQAGGSGAVLVATQVVEQSVDLDADVLISELAPTDMLLQRLGRLWRRLHERAVSEAVLYLIQENASFEELCAMDPKAIIECFGKKAHVYSPYILLRTLEQWESLSQISLPSDIRKIISDTYREKTACQKSLESLLEKQSGKDDKEKRAAKMEANIWQSSSDDRRVPQTRRFDYSEYTFAVCTEKDEELTLLDGTPFPGNLSKREQTKALGRNAVSVYRYHFHEHVKWPHDSRFPAFVKDIDDFFILGKELPELETGVEISYDNELGLFVL